MRSLQSHEPKKSSNWAHEAQACSTWALAFNRNEKRWCKRRKEGQDNGWRRRKVVWNSSSPSFYITFCSLSLAVKAPYLRRCNYRYSTDERSQVLAEEKAVTEWGGRRAFQPSKAPGSQEHRTNIICCSCQKAWLLTLQSLSSFQHH